MSVSAVACVRPLVGVTPDPDVTSHSHVGAWKWEGVGGQGVRDLQTGDNEPVYHLVIGGRATVVEPAGGGGEERRTTRAVAGGRKGLIVRPCAFHASPIGLLVGLLRQLCRKTTKRESKLFKNWAEKRCTTTKPKNYRPMVLFHFLHLSAKFHLKPYSYAQTIII